MNSNLDQLIEQITSNELFKRLDSIIEHHEGWHDHESISFHCIKTANIAREEREGGFIINSEAKKLFLEWMDEKIHGIKRKDVAVLTALIHDCGKILHFNEGSKSKTLSMRKPNSTDQNIFPGHEYWGGKLVVPEILKGIDLSKEVKDLIAAVVKEHGVFSTFFANRNDWPITDLIDFAKSQAGGYYKESLFNMYCDGYTAPGFIEGKKKIEEMFNEPTLYSERKFYIP